MKSNRSASKKSISRSTDPHPYLTALMLNYEKVWYITKPGYYYIVPEEDNPTLKAGVLQFLDIPKLNKLMLMMNPSLNFIVLDEDDSVVAIGRFWTRYPKSIVRLE